MTVAQRTVRAPRGAAITCRSWQTEAAMRMIMNNLDPDVAELPDQLIVYGGSGRAARNWQAFDDIVRTLKRLKDDETLLVISRDQHRDEKTLNATLSRVLAILSQSEIHLHAVETHEPNLERLFLKLTGNKLRD